MVETVSRSSRKEVVDLCSLLGGTMCDNKTDTFKVDSYVVDLSATAIKFLGEVAIDTIIYQARKHGENVIRAQIKNALGICAK